MCVLILLPLPASAVCSSGTSYGNRGTKGGRYDPSSVVLLSVWYFYRGKRSVFSDYLYGILYGKWSVFDYYLHGLCRVSFLVAPLVGGDLMIRLTSSQLYSIMIIE